MTKGVPNFVVGEFSNRLLGWRTSNAPVRQETDLGPAVDEHRQIPGIVSVPDVEVVRRHIQLLVSGSEKLQLGQAHLQPVPPVGQELHCDVHGGGDLGRAPRLP